MDKEGKGNFKWIFIAMIASLVLAYLWDRVPIIKNTANAGIDPIFGSLLSWHPLGGMALIIIFMAFLTTITQKYGTDQETIRELKKEQKELNEKMKGLERGSKAHADMMMKSMEMFKPLMMLSMRPLIYTAIPFILLFRWFTDYFSIEEGIRFLGMSWLWFYLLGSIIVGSILRKVFKVA